MMKEYIQANEIMIVIKYDITINGEIIIDLDEK
jgi:hypothetical protein